VKCLTGKKRVLTGKAKFGIVGDGKELPQIAMAKFLEMDFRSGYYRDQTFAMAVGALTIESFFAQLYADTSRRKRTCFCWKTNECHFATRSLNEDGTWKI
jgi:TPP-dependent pyruvate/acetoin dehydrogenase alpha subunit